ncbi:hypothetical protein A0H81_13649 [Grifola frondosa]|uniref:Uncharacterized protein n=1 Tax=Grifola frondosa TaxID=5627 RepID=A0A1C7LNS2_GRIFR|nr:hypothetical protein A0H81_13649 [Grifola frondosa]
MCNWWLFAVVFLLGVFEPASDLYFSAHDTFLFAPWPLPTCIGFVDDSVTDRLFFGIPIATSAVKIAFELSVFILTVAKTIGIQRETWSLGIRTPLTTLLLRDGSIYFLLLCAFAVADLITRLVPSNNSLVGISSVFTPAVTPILITRFILNLRQVGLADISSDREGTVTGLPTLQFAGSRLIGNLGCQLSHGPSARDDDLDIWDDSEGLPTEETLNPSPDEGGNKAPGANILTKGGRVGDGYI